jgi:uncharacterized CHY-type Zn-finger protein
MWQRMLWVVLLVVCSAATAQQVLPEGKLPPLTHNPLRQNQGAGEQAPAKPDLSVFEGYADAPPFEVVPRKGDMRFFPCLQCHQFMPVNPQPRELLSPHPRVIKHGKGRFWCLNCHDAEDRNHLRTIRGDKVDFDQAYLICGQCHWNRQKDWYFGGHGKRAANWRGERVIYSCPHCHDPHDPTIKGRKPSPRPPVRARLSPMEDGHHTDGIERLWDRYSGQSVEATAHE